MSQITRRELWQASAAATGAALLTCEAGQSSPSRKKKVVIGGGGIAGLCCAYELSRRGHEVTVLEASGRVGGHVKTVRGGELPDGLYVDAGAEQFTKPGYELYWGYVREFNLPHVQDHRREQMLRRIGDRLYTEEQLAEKRVLAGFGLNGREVDYLTQHPWWELSRLYLDRYLDAFQDEYQPFGVGLDDFDKVTLTEALRKDGASAAAVGFIGSNASALQQVWHAAILKRRGVPLWPTQVFRLIGGNSRLPETFASKLGDCVKLDCPITGIQHGESGVTVSYREFRETKQISADYLVCCMSAVMLRQIPITPAFAETKQYAVASVPYYSATRPVLQSRTKFWQEQRTSINIEFSKPDLEHVWSMADEVETQRGLIVGTAGPGVAAERALNTFRQCYPQSNDTIEHATIIDWSRDPWCMACETSGYKPGQLKKLWPTLIQPHGRIHFAGAYCDNLNWGQEAATRSAHRVAKAIHASA